MFEKLFGSKRPYKEVQAPAADIHFLGEPSGPGVPTLKAELVKILVSEGNATVAYVSRVQYGKEEQVRLALVLEGRASPEQMAGTIAGGCRSLVPIDIMFMDSLSSKAKESLRQSVAPFFPVDESRNRLFLINMKIGRGSSGEMPAGTTGAYVAVFVGAPDSEAAAKSAVEYITKRGMEFLDIPDKKIHQLDPLRWSTYVDEAWPEYRSHFPSQQDVLGGVPFGQAFVGPFVCYGGTDAQQQVHGLLPQARR